MAPNRSGKERTTSRVWVPMDPVDPSMARPFGVVVILQMIHNELLGNNWLGLHE